jgi:hypothetical protein
MIRILLQVLCGWFILSLVVGIPFLICWSKHMAKYRRLEQSQDEYKD